MAAARIQLEVVVEVGEPMQVVAQQMGCYQVLAGCG